MTLTLGTPEITAFLDHLAVELPTRNQALDTILFFYKRALQRDVPALDGLERAQGPEHLEPPARLLGAWRHDSGLRSFGVVSPLDR
jgi:hypothetical protein